MSNFTPRTSAPSYSDLRWIQIGSGGYNQCIYGSDGPPSVLPNCTGYVHGRAMEIANVNSDTLGLSFGNAADYYSGSSSAWLQRSEPSLGAIVCYSQIGGWYPGHVSVVEEIIDANTILVSESDYGGSYFKTWTLRREWNWTPFPNPSDYLVSFLGFLKNPYVTPGPGPTPGPGENDPKYAILFIAKKRKEAQNGKRYSGII